jgi:hypothetical protein
MQAITKLLAGCGAIAALASAAPAAAQYYPGYGYGYGSPYGGNVIGQVVNSVLGGGYGSNGYNGYGSYGVNSQAVVNICANAIQSRLSGGGGYGSYGYSSPYGYAGGARVLGISRVEQRSSGGLRVRGVATSGRNVGYGYNSQTPDLTWKCSVDYRGAIVGLDVNRADVSYGANYGSNYGYTPYGNYDYSQYGYRRY